jgi:phage terminase small subunit
MKEEKTASGLTAMQEAFCIAYGLPGSEQYSNATAAAKEAGYSEASASNSGWKNLQSPEIRARISEIQREAMHGAYVNANKVLSDLENLRKRAENKGDLSTAVRCIELIGKSMALFSDGINIQDRGEQTKLDESQQREAIRLANLLLKSGGGAVGYEGNLGDPPSPPDAPTPIA